MRHDVIVIGMLAVLAGCGDLPRPFAPEDPIQAGAPIDAVALLGPRASLMVTPVEGMDLEHSRGLADGVAQELRKRDILAFTRSGGRASWLLQLAAPGPGETTWRLIDPGGRPAAAGKAASTATSLAQQVDAAIANLAPAIPTAVRQSVRLGAVEGVAPEAARLLSVAMRAELKRVGVPVVESGNDSLILRGKIQRTDLGADGEEVQIAWTLAQPDGEEVGTVGQSNRLPRGQLDGRWPAIVGVVAAGAVDGLLDIVEAVEAQRRRGG